MRNAIGSCRGRHRTADSTRSGRSRSYPPRATPRGRIPCSKRQDRRPSPRDGSRHALGTSRRHDGSQLRSISTLGRAMPAWTHAFRRTAIPAARTRASKRRSLWAGGYFGALISCVFIDHLPRNCQSGSTVLPHCFVMLVLKALHEVLNFKDSHLRGRLVVPRALRDSDDPFPESRAPPKHAAAACGGAQGPSVRPRRTGFRAGLSEGGGGRGTRSERLTPDRRRGKHRSRAECGHPGNRRRRFRRIFPENPEN